MTITDEQREEILEAARPLMKWMSDNCHPHCRAIVDSVTVELTEGVASIKTEEFVKD